MVGKRGQTSVNVMTDSTMIQIIMSDDHNYGVRGERRYCRDLSTVYRMVMVVIPWYQCGSHGMKYRKGRFDYLSVIAWSWWSYPCINVDHMTWSRGRDGSITYRLSHGHGGRGWHGGHGALVRVGEILHTWTIIITTLTAYGREIRWKGDYTSNS